MLTAGIGALSGIILIGGWMAWFGIFNAIPALFLIASGATVLGLATIAFLVELLRRLCHLLRMGSPGIAAVFAFLAASAVLGSTYLAVTRFAPGEQLLGNNDPGMYLSAAGQLARTGGIKTHLTGMENLSEAQKRIILRRSAVQFMRGSDPPETAPWSFYIGYPLANQSDMLGPAIPHFPAGFSVILASGLVVGGWPLARAVPAFATILGILALTIFVLRQTGVWSALIFLPLACAHPLISWFSNRHFAEPVLFLLASLLLITLTELPQKPRLAGVVSVVLLLAATTIKIDAVLIIPALAFACLVAPPTQPAWKSILLTSSIVAPATIGFLWLQSGRYFIENLGALAREPVFVAVAAFAVATILFGAISLRSSVNRVKVSNLLRTGFLISSVVTLLYFYAVRSGPAEPDVYFEPALRETIRSYREDTLLRLDSYWIRFGFVAAILGAFFTCWKRTSLPLVAFASLGLGSLLILGYDLRCDPIQPLSMRRLLPFAIQFLIFGVGGWATFGNRRVAPVLCAAVIPLFLVGEMNAHRKMDPKPEFVGVHTFLKEVAASLPQDSMVLIPARSPLSSFAVPLRTFHGKNTWVVDVDKNSRDDRTALRSTVSQWHEEGFRVCVLTHGPQDDLLTGFQPVRMAQIKLESTFQPGSYESISGEVRRFSFPCYISELRIVDPTDAQDGLPR